MASINLTGFRAGLTKENKLGNLIYTATSTPGEPSSYRFFYFGETIDDNIDGTPCNTIISYTVDIDSSLFWFQKNKLTMDTDEDPGSPRLWKINSNEHLTEYDGWYYNGFWGVQQPSSSYGYNRWWWVGGHLDIASKPYCGAVNALINGVSAVGSNLYYSQENDASYYIRPFSVCMLPILGTPVSASDINMFYMDVQKVANADGATGDSAECGAFMIHVQEKDQVYMPYIDYNGYRLTFECAIGSAVTSEGVPLIRYSSAPEFDTTRCGEYLVMVGKYPSYGGNVNGYTFQGFDVYGNDDVFSAKIGDPVKPPLVAYIRFSKIGDDSKVFELNCFGLDESSTYIADTKDDYMLVRTSKGNDYIYRIIQLTDNGPVVTLTYTYTYGGDQGRYVTQEGLRKYNSEMSFLLVVGVNSSSTYSQEVNIISGETGEDVIFSETTPRSLNSPTAITVYEDGNGLQIIRNVLVNGSSEVQQTHVGNVTTVNDFTAKYITTIDLPIVYQTENYFYGVTGNTSPYLVDQNKVKCVRKSDLYTWDMTHDSSPDTAGCIPYDFMKFSMLGRPMVMTYWTQGYNGIGKMSSLYGGYWVPPTFSVVSTVPENNAEDVKPDTTVKVTFNDYPMDNTFADTSGNFTLVYDDDSTNIPWTLHDVTGKSVTVTPNTKLVRGRTVKANLGTSIQSAQEIALTPYQFKFSIALFKALANFPLNLATNVPGNTYISITFNQDPDLLTITPDNVIIVSNGVDIISYSVLGISDGILYLQPSTQLPSASVITVSALAGVKDTPEEDVLSNAPWIFNFTTMTSVPPVMPVTSQGAGWVGTRYGIQAFNRVKVIRL